MTTREEERLETLMEEFGLRVIADSLEESAGSLLIASDSEGKNNKEETEYWVKQSKEAAELGMHGIEIWLTKSTEG